MTKPTPYTRHPLAEQFASGLRSLLLRRGRFVPAVGVTRPAVAHPAGSSSGGHKALRGYQRRYTHVLSAYGADENAARLANARKGRKK